MKSPSIPTLSLIALLLLGPVAAERRPVVLHQGTHLIVKGVGFDLSEVLAAVFKGRTIVYADGAPAIVVDREFTGTLAQVKAKLSKAYHLSIQGQGALVSVTSVADPSDKGPAKVDARISYKKEDKKHVFIVQKATLEQLLTVIQRTITVTDRLDVAKGLEKLELSDVTIEGEDIDALLAKLDKGVDQLKVVQTDLKPRVFHFLKTATGKEPVADIWTLKNSAIRSLAGEKVGELGNSAENVADILNKVQGASEDKDKVAKAVGNQIVLRGEKNIVKQAKFLLATALDIPSPQVRLDVWTVELSTEASGTEDFHQRLNRVHAGYGMVRYLLQRSSLHMADYLRHQDKQSLPVTSALLSRVNFDPSPARPLSPLDQMILMRALLHNEANFRCRVIKPLLDDITRLKDGLKGDNDRDRHLNHLLDDIRIRLGDLTVARDEGEKPPGSGRVPFHFIKEACETAGRLDCLDSKDRLEKDLGSGYLGFLAAYLDFTQPDWRTQEDPLHPVDSGARSLLATTFPPTESPEVLMRRQLETDVMLRFGVRAVENDLEEIYFEPLLNWVHNEVRDVSEFSIVGRSEVVVDSRNQASVEAHALSYTPITPRIQPKENSFGKVITSPDIGAAALEVLFEPQPLPIFTHLGPGISMNTVPSVSAFGDQAHLSISLKLAVEADDPDKLQDKGIKPVDIVKDATLKTDTTIVGYDILELSTIGLTDTRRGDPWGIPILQDIPLIGPLIFRFPGRIVRKHKEVLMFVQATILPKTMELVR